MPFKGPFGIGHECVAQVTEVGAVVAEIKVGDVVVVPWAISCGSCQECRLGLTAKCSTMRVESPGRTLAAFGFGPSCGPWGGMVTDSLRVPFADHMLVRVPKSVDRCAWPRPATTSPTPGEPSYPLSTNARAARCW